MEDPGAALEVQQQSSSNSRRFGMHLTSANLLPGPLSALLEFTGILRGRGSHHVEIDDREGGTSSVGGSLGQYSPETPTRIGDGGAEVSIRIFGVGEPEQMRAPDGHSSRNIASGVNISPSSTTTAVFPVRSAGLESISYGPAISPQVLSTEERGEELPDTAATGNGNGNGNGNGRDVGSQRYDFQQLARWIEQALPFAILLFMVFIRQHLQGFLVVFWITVVMVKANDLLRKQAALKNERRPIVLVTLGFALAVHVVGVYWWHRHEALWRPLILLPPQDIPNFGHAIFIIVVNDTLVRQSVMALKCGLLVYYRNSRGRNYRCQAQLLTLVEYVLLLYRALIPGPVWYRFFLNKEYGNLFSSLTTGLYLTFKLTSTLEKVQTFLAALRALSRREVQYGSYATSEEVLAAGDMCAICQEKMHAPIALRCNHIFCEDCVSEWFERERTCPLCRAVVRSVGLRSYGDGSTSLLIQLF